MAQPELVLGPLLRHVDSSSATVWVETTASCEVSVLGASTATFEVAGHHYALVVLTGLEPGSSIPYEVRLNGRPVWPEPDASFPPSRIRTLAETDGEFRLVFGSCRKPHDYDALGPDALVGYARRMATLAESDWPDALLLLGDQVYADETTDEIRQWLATRRDLSVPPGTEVADFEEYTRLYHESWCDPPVRWLMSTVPVSMIFDDHDVHDDWNTSDVWRSHMRQQPWWAERLRGAFMSYWVYQHLGNLGPDELVNDPIATSVVNHPGDQAEVLREMADVADNELDGTKHFQWSYRRQFGRTRLLVVDSRAGRILGEGHRAMLDEDEFRWLEANAAGDHDHLLIGSSLPWLLPPALSHLESINEVACRRSGWRGRLAEWLRQAADFEHWAAFRTSFDRLARLIADTGAAGGAPATVSVLSGDVHHAYIARARFGRRVDAAVNQLTCSPVHNTTPLLVQVLFRAGWWAPLARLTDRWSRRCGIEPLPVRWSRTVGPEFSNAIMTLVLDGRDATVVLERAEADGLVEHATVPLT